MTKPAFFVIRRKKNSYLCAMKQKGIVYYPLLLFLLLCLWIVNLMYGAVSIPLQEVIQILFGKGSEQVAWQNIVLQSRFPQSITALLAGASLATSGLLLQTLFRNPLAGPSILGISDGANLGVALVMFFFGSSFGFFSNQSIGGSLAIVFAALAGAGCILGIILFFSTKVSNNVMLLIIGIMIGYLASSLISILNYYATADRVRAFVLWGMGDFSGVSNDRLPFFTVCTFLGLSLTILLIKPLNALLLGETYAANLGVKIKQTRMWILICTGLLTATTTAFCGPISFIGLSVPHIARLLLGTSNHKLLVPVTMLTGSCIALLCNFLSVLPGTNMVLPLNAVTPILGAPVIIYVIVNRATIQYFN
jgi:iron complex transport system permease protein